MSHSAPPILKGTQQMANVTVHFRDGTKQEFKHSGRPGGSDTKSVKYEGNFVIVTDEYYNSTAIPMDLVKEVKVDVEARGGW